MHLKVLPKDDYNLNCNTVAVTTHHSISELQRRSSKVLEKRSLKSLLWVGNLYQLFTTLGLEPVSIITDTRPGSSIKQPTPNELPRQLHKLACHLPQK